MDRTCRGKKYWYHISLVGTIILGFVFELVENADWAIYEYSGSSATSRGFKGDTWVNIAGDMLCVGGGWLLADQFTARGHWYLILLATVLQDILSFFYMKNGAVLTLVMYAGYGEKLIALHERMISSLCKSTPVEILNCKGQ